MKALKCDNCGEFYDISKNISRLVFVDNEDAIAKRIDICPGCLKAINKALDDRKKITIDVMEDDRK